MYARRFVVGSVPVTPLMRRIALPSASAISFAFAKVYATELFKRMNSISSGKAAQRPSTSATQNSSSSMAAAEPISNCASLPRQSNRRSDVPGATRVPKYPASFEYMVRGTPGTSIASPGASMWPTTGTVSSVS